MTPTELRNQQLGQKMVKAMQRLHFDINTPCHVDGQCHNCNSPQSICNYIHFLRNSSRPGRIIVVLVGENLGY